MKKIKIYLILSICFFGILEANHGNTSTAMTVQVRSLVDTLNVGLEDTVIIGFSPGDIMMEVIQVPGDLTLNGVGVGVHQWNTDGTNPSLKVEVYRPDTAGYPFTSAGSMYSFGDTAESGWIGFAHSAENDSIAFPDPGSASNLVWNNFSAGTSVCSAEPEVADGQPVLGTKVLPAGNDVMIPRPSGGSAGLFFVNFAGGGAQFVKDEYIAVVVTYLADGAGDPADDLQRVGRGHAAARGACDERARRRGRVLPSRTAVAVVAVVAVASAEADAPAAHAVAFGCVIDRVVGV